VSELHGSFGCILRLFDVNPEGVMSSVIRQQFSSYRGTPRLLILALFSILAACGGGEIQPQHNEVDDALSTLILDDDTAYLAQLGLMRGHLHVGVALYDLGERVDAIAHMKHPESEMYAELAPGLQRRGATEFAQSLQALAAAVESRQPESAIDSLYRALERNIAQAEAVVGDLDAARIAAVISLMLASVAQEYVIAVSPEGRMINAHEYQDALGFVHVIRIYASVLGETSADVSRLQGLNTQLAFLEAAFQGLLPGRNANLTPPATVNQVVNQLQLTLRGF